MRHVPSVMRAESDWHCAIVVVCRREPAIVYPGGLGGYWQQYIQTELWAIKDRREYRSNSCNEWLGECIYKE